MPSSAPERPEFSLSLEDLPIGAFEIDARGRCAPLNGEACRMLGSTTDALRARGDAGATPPAVALLAPEALLALRERGALKCTTRLARADGPDLLVTLDARVSGEGRYVAFCSDISEREQLEHELRERLRVEHLMAEIIGDFAQTHAGELDGALTRALKRMAAYFGADRASVFEFTSATVSNTHEWCADPADSQTRMLQRLPASTFGYYYRLLLAGEPVNVSTIADLPPGEAAGEIAWAEEHGFRSLLFVPLQRGDQLTGALGFYGPTGETVVWPQEFLHVLRFVGGVFAGVLEVRATAAARDALEAQLRHSEKMRVVGQLAAGVAHDFNNQLTGIIGLAELLDPAAPAGEFDETVRGILQCADRAAALTRDLLAFGRRGDFTIEPVDLHAVVREVQSLVTASFGPGVRVEPVLRSSRPVTLGDRGQIQGALLNVALNAAQAMPGGGVITIRSADRALGPAEAAGFGDVHAPGRFVEVRIDDEGPGMPPEVVERAFEPFFTTKPPSSGSGMGLASVYGTMVQHGGAIRLESEPGRGTRAVLLFPVSERHGAFAVETAVATAAGAGGPAARGTVFVVDDEPAVLRVMQRTLEDHGATVRGFRDGAEAVAAFREDPEAVSLLVLDLAMPGMDGGAVFDAVRELRPGLPVLIVTGYHESERTKRLAAHTNVSLLQKPFQGSALLAEVERLAAPYQRAGR